MPFEWRVFELAKEPEHPEQNQDAWWLNPVDGVAAIADGVTSGIFSGPWARLLTRAVVENWPDPTEEEMFASWLAGLRRQWEQEIDTTGLAWYQRAKLREGGFSTLVWLRLLDNQGLAAGADKSPLEVLAIGDSCLFHVRNDELLESFPLDASLQFDSSPLVLGSVDLKRDDQLQFERLEISCQTDDLLVLCTDAVAAWALDRLEQGDPVAWSDYWDMPRADWAEQVCLLRSQSKMRYDDATLVLIRVSQRPGDSPANAATPTAEQPAVPGPEGEHEVTLLAADDWGESSEPTSENALTPDAATYSPSDTYQLQTPAPKPRETPEISPTVPENAPQQAPPPPPAAAMPSDDGDWRDQVNRSSERLFKKFSQGLARVADKLQEAKDSAVKKLRDTTEGSGKDDDSSKPAS